MRILLAIVVAAGLGWSGYWWWGASATERNLAAWLEDRRAAGWLAEVESLGVTGYPNRFDTMIRGLELADPWSGWAWSAPEFQILALSYRPHHVIAVWPGEQVVASPYATTRVSAAQMRGSVVFDPTPALRLNRSSVEIEDMILVGQGWEAQMATARLATRQAETRGADRFAHDVSFRAHGVMLPEATIRAFGVGAGLPQRMDAARLEATLVFDRPWDRAAIETENPRIEQVHLRNLELGWGEMDLRGRGTLDIDAAGFVSGQIDLNARNWRQMLGLAVEAGLVPRGLAGTAETALGLLARLSGDADGLSVPLTFADGQTRLGPVTLGPAPRLVHR